MSLIATLKKRFEANMHRHPDVRWATIENILTSKPHLFGAVQWMEDSGGMPDVVSLDDTRQRLAFVDCSPESPAGRRSLCYDEQALHERKANKPAGSAVGVATHNGVHLLNEHDYFCLQRIEPFDRTTSSWLETPTDVRERGGALFGDHRFGRTFVYHNGAQSYYAARGFRAKVCLD